jgi:hypothetical protein
MTQKTIREQKRLTWNLGKFDMRPFWTRCVRPKKIKARVACTIDTRCDIRENYMFP